MKNLEDIIRDNKDYLFDATIGDSHLERFQKRLALKQQKQNSSRKIFYRVAAALIITLACSAVLRYSFQANNSKYEMYGDYASEYSEIEFYYTNRCNYEFNKLKTYNIGNNSVQIATQLENLDSIYNSLKGELKNTPGNEQIINAMIQNLQMRLQLLEQVNSLLDNRKNEIKAYTL